MGGRIIGNSPFFGGDRCEFESHLPNYNKYPYTDCYIHLKLSHFIVKFI